MDIVSRKTLTGILLYIVYFFCLLPVGIFSFKRPAYNWDMLPYMAIVVRMDHSDFNLVHKIVYNSVKEKAPPQLYRNLTDSTFAYRKRMAESPNDFYQQLPFYVIKPLYTGMIYLFYKAGVSLPESTVLPSVLAYFLIGLLLLYWLRKYLNPYVAFIGALLLMYSPYMSDLARTSTPDCLSAFLLLAAIYFTIEKPSVSFLFLFLALSVLCRIDNIITSFVILSFLSFTGKWKKKIILKKYILMLSVLAACYFATTITTTRDFGWDILYFPKFFRYYDLSYQLQTSFSFKTYAALSYSHAITAMLFTHFTFFAFLVLLLLSQPLPMRFNNFSFEQLFSLLLILIILVRFVLYPNLTDRFYVSFYLSIIIILVKKINLQHNEYSRQAMEKDLNSAQDIGYTVTGNG